ncbi:MAG TPA: outer membrane lipoprotein-sorting protein [Fimbriimonadaceae bacterium]|nr:outer membrane lipoprotein-sorting protein [Fimbriimonadaceae bacterium]
MMSLLAVAALTLVQPAQKYDVDDIVQKSFRDATFVARIIKGSQKELKKINDDFAYSYRFTFMKAQVKEPFMVRLESTVEDTNLLYIINGDRKKYSIPRIKINKTENISLAPGKRQTPMDFGILTPSLFKGDFMVANFQRVDRESGDLVFDITYVKPKLDDTSRHRVWIDKDKKYITKRVWFSQEGRQLATFLYDQPKQDGGVWFPSRCTVKNVEDNVAGVTQYESIKINTGLSDSLFKL